MENSPEVQDLGHGVTVRRDDDGTLVVTSAWLELGWLPRRGHLPGTAVTLGDDLLEVVEEAHGAAGRRFRLAPWPEGEAARAVDHLDAARAAVLAATSAGDRVQRTRRRLLVALLPLTGMLPGATQQRLQRQCNFPAARATAVSAILELAVAVFLSVHLLSSTFGGGILPQPLGWLGFLGPFLLVGSLLRLWWAATQREPMGSFLALPLALLEPRPASSDPLADYRPRPLQLDPETGRLELATDRSRPDWVEDGVLQYRERRYRLVEKLPAQGRMVYRLQRVDDRTPLTLRLLPPQPPTGSRVGPGEPGLLGLTFRILLLSFAPRPYQERWFRARGMSPLVPTVLCALVEAFGGAVNLTQRPTQGPAQLVDLLFLVEGLVRLGLVLGRGQAVGSVLGLPLLPLYRRWVSAPPPPPPPPP